MTDEATDDQFAGALIDLRERKSQRLHGSMTAARQFDPDHEAKSIALGEKTGVPSEAVSRNMDAVEKRFSETDLDQLQTDYPSVSKFLSDPENAKVAQDDVSALVRVSDTLRSVPGELVSSIGRGIHGAAEGYSELLEWSIETSKKLAGEDAHEEGQGKFLANVAGFVDELSQAAGRGGYALKGAGEFISPPVERQTLATDVAGGLGQIAGQISTMLVLGPAAGMTLLVGQGAEQQIERMDQVEGEISEEDRRIALLAGSSVTAISERVGLGFLMRKLPEAAKSAIKKKLVDVFLSGGAEAVQEVVEAIGHNMTALATYDPEAEIFDVDPREPTAAFGAGSIFRGIVLMAAGGRRVRGQKQTAETNQAIMNALGEEAGESKLLERLPQKYREWVAEARKDGPIENVYIEAEKLEEYFQSEGVDPFELYDAMPGLEAQVSEAVALNADVVIPIEDFATYIAPTPHLEALSGDMRLNVDDVSANVAETLEMPAMEEFAEAEPDQRVFDDVQARQIAAGATPDVAAKNAAVWGSWFKVMGGKSGQDAFDLYEQYGLKVVRKLPESLKGVEDLGALIETVRDVEKGPIGERLKTARTALAEFDKAADKEGLVAAQEAVTALEGQQAESIQLEQAITAARKGGPTERAAYGKSLLEFARDMGIRDDRGDLRGQDVDKTVKTGGPKKPFQKNLLRDDGQSIDDVALAAQEAGYFPELGGDQRVDINQFIDAITEEIAGTPRYSSEKGDEAKVAERQAAIDLIEELDRRGVSLEEDTDVIIEALQQPVDIEGALFQDDQLRIPGTEAEQVEDRSKAEIKVRQQQAKMRRAGQVGLKDQEGGLFSAERDQDELFQRDVSEIGFYSAAADAADNLKQAKGSPAQMLVMLKKSPGVKAEEIEWSGLAEFLEGRKSVTRDEIAEFLRAGGVRVEETVLSAEAVDRLINVDSPYAIPEVLRVVREDQGQMDDALITTLENEGDAYRALTANFPELAEDENWAETVLRDLIGTTGNIPAAPKFADYTLPGGENYREVLLTLPISFADLHAERNILATRLPLEDLGDGSGRTVGQRIDEIDEAFETRKEKAFVDGHFDQPNVIVHLRVTDRTGPKSEKILFIEEVQSDWHQAGRKRGYRGQNVEAENELKAVIAKLDEYQPKLRENRAAQVLGNDIPHPGIGDEISALNTRRHELQNRVGLAGVPDAPFKKTWHTLALKRAMRMAVEGGYDTVAWTPGEVQADRYDLSKQISKVELSNTSGGVGKADTEFTSGTLVAFDLGGKQVMDQFINDPNQIEEYVGKDIAQKLIEQEGQAGQRAGMGAHIREVSGLDLKVGGEGMKTFYDKMLPSAAKKLTKKLGGEVGMQRFGGGPVVHAITVTPELKATAEAGLPLFQDVMEDPRGSIRFGAGETIITLMEKSNLSTFLHETGHFFLNAFGDIAEDADAPQDIKDDYAAILKYLEVENRSQIGRDQHEVFARTFEAYLFEGKAPSIALQSTFDRFAAWLLDIYKNVVNLNVPINDEIRGVFDRMLATSEEIEAAEAQQNYSMIFDSAEAGEMTEAEYVGLQKAGQRAESAGKSELLKRALIETRRVRTKQWREEKAKVQEEVAETVDSQRVNQVRLFLRTGEGQVPENIAGRKLDRKAVADILGSEAKRLPVGSVRKTGGVDPDTLAIVFGYDSGDAMLRAMLDQPKRAATIKAEVDRIMMERHGDLMNDGTIQREAVEAVHNDERGRFIAGELKYLSRGAGVAPTPVSLAKEYARKAISGKKVVDATQIGLYAAAERRAAVAAQKALGKKDFKEAANQKRKQLINHYMFIEARKAADQVDKILRQAAKYRKKGVRKNIAQDYLDQIDALMERFDLRKSVSMKAIERRKSLAEWIATQEEAGEDIIIPAKLRKEAYRKSYKIMTMEEIRGLYDSLKNVEHLGRHKDEYTRNKQRRELDADAAILDAQLSENIPPHKQPVNPQRFEEVRKRGIFNFIGVAVKTQSVIEVIDGGLRDGPAYQILKRAIDEGQIRHVKRLKESGERLSEIYGKHFGKGGIIKTTQNLTKKKVYIAAIDESLTKEEMLGAALNQGNEGSQIKFREGRGWSQAQVDAILDNLTESDWGFVSDIWAYLHEFWPEISALEKERTGVAPEKVEAKPVQTKFGELAGGYYPLMYDAVLDLKARHLRVEQTLKEMQSGSFTRAQTKRGHAEARVEGVQRPVRIDLGVITQHLSQVILDLELGPAIDAGQKILHHGKTRNTIVKHLGPDGFVALDLWMKDVAVNSVVAANSFDRALRSLRAGVSVGAMAWKLSTAIIQLTGLVQSWTVLRSKYLAKGMYRFMMSGVDRESIIKDVYAKSDFMMMRATTFHRDIMDAVNQVQGKDNQTKAMKTYFWLIVKMQQLVDMPTWLGAYEKAIDEGKSEANAVRFADLTVEDSQGSGLMTALSPIERGTLGENTRLSETVKLFTTFYNYYNTKGNIAYRSLKQTKFSNPKDVAKLMVDFVMLFWVEGLIGEFILGRAPDFEDDDDELWSYMFWNGIREMAGTLPLVREVSSTMEGFSGAPGGTRALETFGSSAAHLARTAEEFAEGEEVDPVRLLRDIMSLYNAVGPVKIPVSQIDIALTAAQKAAEGEDVLPMDLIRKPRK